MLLPQTYSIHKLHDPKIQTISVISGMVSLDDDARHHLPRLRVVEDPAQAHGMR